MRAIRGAQIANRPLFWFLIIFGGAGLLVGSLTSHLGARGILLRLEGSPAPEAEMPASDWVAGNQNSSVPLLPICKIQGSGFATPYEGQTVRARGVVVADLDETALKGIFIQQSACDSNPETSDGIFVFIGERIDVASLGDRVEVSAVVREFFGQTELEATPADLTVLGTAEPIPIPVELNPPFENFQSRLYFEAREGMLLNLVNGRVVGPTSPRGLTWLIRSDLGIRRVFRDDPRGTGEVIAISDAGGYKLPLPAKVGDRVEHTLGVLVYSLGQYQLVLTAEPTIEPGSGPIGDWKTREPSSGLENGDLVPLRVATINFKNMFDTTNEPFKSDPVLSASAYRRKLSKLALTIHSELDEPDVIGVQEVENGLVLQDLVNWPELEADYAYVWIDGPDVRGIDVALLVRLDRFRVSTAMSRQGCTDLVDGLGPDGNRAIDQPINAVTCDTDGDGILDGNRLFSRPPLVVRLERTDASGSGAPGSGQALWVIVNHWKSKSQDTATIAHTLPRRVRQAEFVAALVGEIQGSEPGTPLMVLGDLNDFPDSPPLAELEATGLFNLVRAIGRDERYTFIFQGVSQTLDHILISPEMVSQLSAARAIHINADFPYVFEGVAESAIRASDHDPLLVELNPLNQRYFLPIFLGQRTILIL